MKLESDENVVVQYGRLDNRQTNLAYYTAIGYSEERRNNAEFERTFRANWNM